MDRHQTDTKSHRITDTKYISHHYLHHHLQTNSIFHLHSLKIELLDYWTFKSFLDRDKEHQFRDQSQEKIEEGLK